MSFGMGLALLLDRRQDSIEWSSAEPGVGAREYRSREKVSTAERGGHGVLGSEANISTIGCNCVYLKTEYCFGMR
jgi:hypothetical protein